MSHANARLTERGRLILCERDRCRSAGRPRRRGDGHLPAVRLPVVAPLPGSPRRRAGPATALADRSSRPERTPKRTKRNVERKICNLRRRCKLGPARIGARLVVPASTVHAVLVRHGLNRLAWIDRPTGEPIRRYERERPGELVHMDIKKLGKLPDGGGWRAHGRGSAQHKASRRAGTRVRGYDYVHSVVDDHSRLAYSEILPDEQADTVVAFWARAHAFFSAHGVTIERVLTDNGPAYRSNAFNAVLAGQGAKHKIHKALPAPDQRQGRTVQPDPARRVGLRSDLHLRQDTRRGAQDLAPPLQLPSLPHRARRAATRQPCHQGPRFLQLDPFRWAG